LPIVFRKNLLNFARSFLDHMEPEKELLFLSRPQYSSRVFDVVWIDTKPGQKNRHIASKPANILVRDL